MASSELTTFICLFHSTDHAEAAVNALETAGFQRNAITSVWKENEGSTSDSVRDELTDVGVPSRDLAHLSDGVSKGGVVVSLTAEESRSDEIEKIFHKYSADKIDETGMNTGAAAPVMATEALATPRSAEPVLQAEGAVVPVVQEDLLVGKREVERGGVRVFKRVVEEPVTESVNLHEEHVYIDRRPVDRAVNSADIAAASQTIELTETEEIPVISKVSRVVEEVRVGLQESDRTETVRDTVRHTEVDVEPVTETVATDTRGGGKDF